MDETPAQRPPWTLVATGTIDPKGMRFTARNDPEVRLRDYAGALRRWLDATDLPIVFCENSGYDLGRLREAVGAGADRIEWLGFAAPDFPEERGKGYGEILILRHALERSARIGPETRVVKMTGRLFVANLPAILRDTGLQDEGGRPPDIGCDLNPVTLAYSDSRLFFARPAFYRDYLFAEAETMTEEVQPIVNFERILSRSVLRAVADGMSWRALAHNPRYEGFSGTYGHAYKNRLHAVREGARRLRAKTDRFVV